MNDDHIPVPNEHRGEDTFVAVQQTDNSLTIHDMAGSGKYITSDYYSRQRLRGKDTPAGLQGR